MAGGAFPSFLAACTAGSTCATNNGGTLEVLSSPTAMHGAHVLRGMPLDVLVKIVSVIEDEPVQAPARLSRRGYVTW